MSDRLPSIQFGLSYVRPEWCVTMTVAAELHEYPYEVDWAFVLKGAAIGAIIGAAFMVAL